MKRPRLAHRKFWEFAYICQALSERGALKRGARGLGFGVGREPLSAVFASMGCRITATDAPPNSKAAATWAGPMHASKRDELNLDDICSAKRFRKNVQFRPVDMNAIPRGLHDFDFLWSSCALEHIGGLEAGIDFVRQAMKCLRPGGIAVHTTEFNISSNSRTMNSATLAVYRRRDIGALIASLVNDGHKVASTAFRASRSRPDCPPYDRFVFEAGFHRLPHVCLTVGRYVITSFGLIVVRG